MQTARRRTRRKSPPHHREEPRKPPKERPGRRTRAWIIDKNESRKLFYTSVPRQQPVLLGLTVNNAERRWCAECGCGRVRAEARKVSGGSRSFRASHHVRPGGHQNAFGWSVGYLFTYQQGWFVPNIFYFSFRKVSNGFVKTVWYTYKRIRWRWRGFKFFN